MNTVMTTAINIPAQILAMISHKAEYFDWVKAPIGSRLDVRSGTGNESLSKSVGVREMWIVAKDVRARIRATNPLVVTPRRVTVRI
jgi:hypothetical protein